MANEITVSNSLSVKNGEHVSLNSDTKQINQSAQGGWSAITIVGTSEEDMLQIDVTVLGWIFFKNLDDANYVQWGAKDTTMKTIGRLEAGESACFRMEPSVTLRWIANTAACKVLVELLED